ncbi:MAG TPA: TonB family protein [Pyrinomonadaceae bacterium]|nr:TonB family protein [Pyrinomonadaceae bacterium]
MQSSHRIVTLHFGIALFLSLALIILGTSTSTNAQQPASNPSEDRERGIQLYKQGDTKGAIEVLRATVNRDKEDGDAWHYLGLALLGVGDKSGARKAFEKAATLRIDDLYRFNYTGPPKTDEERKARRQATLARLDSALDSVEHYVALTPKPSSEWRTRLDNLRKDKEYYEKAPNTGIFSAKDVTTKARIVSKPEPTYTEEARQHDEVGTVILRAVFAFDGTVRNIVVFRGLKYGLNERAVQAARKIKFVPATKDGRPVSMYMQLEYNFNLY